MSKGTGDTPHLQLDEILPRQYSESLTSEEILRDIARRMMYSVVKDRYTATDLNVFTAVAYAVRDRLMERWFTTQHSFYENDVKRIYYLSLEFLMGRSLEMNVLNLRATEGYREALARFGASLDTVAHKEADAGLGNGGLGRLAACFLDSAATLRLPFYGYGIRYEYGIFRQKIEDGFQIEQPDNWLRYGNPWEIAHPDALFPVQFYGKIRHYRDARGDMRIEWYETEDLYAMAYDVPIAGYANDHVNSLRLWAAKSSREFDLAQFNSGDYMRAVEDKNNTENISKVLYPSDERYAGKELRLKQQYFFVSASLQDIIRRFLKKPGRTWDELPDKVAIQLNDTHPAIAIPELMRVLVDNNQLTWEKAWDLTRAVFAFTNHTVLPEALESWSEELLSRLLPRHFQIIEEIDRRHRLEVASRFPGDHDREQRMAIVAGEGGARSVRMANLAIAGSHSVNGVAALHTDILRHVVFRDFAEQWPERFNNKTNGITPRRWMLKANPAATDLITEAIGEGWLRDLDRLEELRPFAGDPEFRRRWMAIRTLNKARLAKWIEDEHRLGILADHHSLFDIQVKRIHEYKRQLLNMLHVIDLYHRIRDGEIPPAPRTVMLGGKAAPSYVLAKLIIKLVNAIGQMVSEDPVVSRWLRVLFIPNYGVSAAEMIFPACDLSEQISTAGTEASGTGNMKAALNGAITIGTMDGANVEIHEAVGGENILIFGHGANEIAEMRDSYDPLAWIHREPRLARVIQTLASGDITPRERPLFQALASGLTTHDRYFLCADFGSYVATQDIAMRLFTDPERWARMSIMNVAGVGRFSSDRTVAQYAREIWGVEPNGGGASAP